MMQCALQDRIQSKSEWTFVFLLGGTFGAVLLLTILVGIGFLPLDGDTGISAARWRYRDFHNTAPHWTAKVFVGTAGAMATLSFSELEECPRWRCRACAFRSEWDQSLDVCRQLHQRVNPCRRRGATVSKSPARLEFSDHPFCLLIVYLSKMSEQKS
jgi:hypothetical protein